jgi:putative transposase
MFRRKQFRLSATTYRGKQTYFITICTHQRNSIFSDQTVGLWLIDNLISTAVQQNFLLHAYCVMPDHLHLLLEGRENSTELRPFLYSFKQQTGFAYQSRAGARLWQTRYYDHLLRDPNETETIAWYIWLNPIRKNLCTAPQHFPLSGSQTIDWKSRCAPARLWLPPWRTKTVPP